MIALQSIWFLVIGFLIVGYVVLDGCDLGIGIIHLGCPDREKRRELLRAISPYWDGNEVWLISLGAVLFAAFPAVYAGLASALYLPLTVLVFALIFRAVSIEFASQELSPRWQRAWEIGFGLGSAVAVLLFGVAAGNILRGIPMNARGDLTVPLLDILNPYALLVGVTAVVMLIVHGALFAQLKTGPATASLARECVRRCAGCYVALLLGSMIASVLTQPHLVANYVKMPGLWVLPASTVASTIALVVYNRKEMPVKALRASGFAILLLFASLGAALYPTFLPALGSPSKSLTVFNASSSALTLSIVLGVVAVGMAFVIGYTLYVRKPFRGKLS